MRLRNWFPALALSLCTWSAYSQCVDELNAYERAEENAINSATAREELNPRALKPSELRKNYEVSVRQFVTSTDTSFFTASVLEEGINNNRQRLAELERVQRNPQRGKQSARLCHPERPNWAACVSAAFAVNVARARIDLCQYEQRLAAMRGTPTTNSAQSQQSRQSDQTHQTANTPEQQMTQRATAQARETQAKGDADAKKQGRRRHDPAMEAHECIQPNFGGLYGGMVNSCPYKVNYTYCGSRPTENSWLKDIMECEKQKFGADGVGPNRESASHTKGVQSIHWFACKDPALPMDSSFEGGQIQARCRVLFAN